MGGVWGRGRRARTGRSEVSKASRRCRALKGERSSVHSVSLGAGAGRAGAVQGQLAIHKQGVLARVPFWVRASSSTASPCLVDVIVVVVEDRRGRIAGTLGRSHGKLLDGAVDSIKLHS